MDNLQIIQSKIYEIRGQKVMLDFDLAEMYGTETKRLKDAFLHNANFDIFLFIILLDTYQRTLYIPTPKQGTHNYCP